MNPISTGNYYTDECLLAAGGRNLGTLDFYQFHTYTYNGQWDPSEPFKVPTKKKVYVH